MVGGVQTVQSFKHKSGRIATATELWSNCFHIHHVVGVKLQIGQIIFQFGPFLEIKYLRGFIYAECWSGDIRARYPSTMKKIHWPHYVRQNEYIVGSIR